MAVLLADRPLYVVFARGYSVTSVFHRAFKRWTGQTAGAYQAAHP